MIRVYLCITVDICVDVMNDLMKAIGYCMCVCVCVYLREQEVCAPRTDDLFHCAYHNHHHNDNSAKYLQTL